jgi:hypothetical protein
VVVMRTIRRIVRGDDMPLFGTITRIKRGLYEVVIKFVASKRVLHVERIGAPNVTAVKLFFKREYPTLTWGRPKYGKRIKTNAAKQNTTTRHDAGKAKVLRRRKKAVPRKVQTAKPSDRRADH